jgi:signal peptidase I
MPKQVWGGGGHEAVPDRGAAIDGGTGKQRRKTARMGGATAVLFILVFILWGFTTNLIPSRSMEPTLMPGDHVIIMRGWLAYPLGRMPQRGDIITFHPPKAAMTDDSAPHTNDSSEAAADPAPSSLISLPRKPKREILIKRVIGLPGDTVQMIDGVVNVNGKPLPEKYKTTPVEDPENAIYPYAGDTPLKVEPGHLFVLGDNRNNSDDGRYWGTLERKDVVGKCVGVLFHEKEIAQEADEGSAQAESRQP